MLFSVSRSFMPSYRRCPFRLKASVQELENNIQRYRSSLAMHDTFLAHCKPLWRLSSMRYFHSYAVHPILRSSRSFFAVSTSRFLIAVVRARNKMQRGMWLVERSFPDKPKVVTRHSGVSYACLLVPVVRHSPPRAGARALGKGRLTSVLLATATRFPVPTWVSFATETTCPSSLGSRVHGP